MNIVDWILFVLFALCVCYLLLYAIASKFYRVPEFPEARTLRRFVILFPAYKEDRVIVSSVRSFLRQEYPKEMFDIIAMKILHVAISHSVKFESSIFKIQWSAFDSRRFTLFLF